MNFVRKGPRDIKIGESYSPDLGKANIFSWERKPGRYDLLHEYENHRADWDHPQQKFPRCSMFVCDGNVKFMGAYLPHELRGLDLFSDFMAELNAVAQKVGGVFDETVTIRKPAISRRLMDSGFSPQDEKAPVVEILPFKVCEPRIIRVGVSEFDEAKLRTEAAEHHFFEVVSNNDLNDYPMTNPDRSMVAINTRYSRDPAHQIETNTEFDFRRNLSF